jgi:sigma-B regulation protein RsbU (phosphoserine phosphatase)
MLPVHRGGVIAEMIASRGPTIIQSVDWADDPVFGESLSGYDSALAVPFAGDHLPMTWVVLLRRSPARFTDDDLEQTVLRVALIASLLDSQALAQEVAKAHRLIDSEVRRVGQIQRNLLPDPLPEIPGLTIATSYETFGQAGGDLYDFVPLDEPTSEQQHWAIFIADASGHGPSAAVVIAIVQALLHSHPPGLTSPAGLLQHLNSHLCDRPIESSFVTAFLGVCETSSRRFEFSCAGHPPPLLIRASAPAVTYLDSTNGLPLGIDPAERFQQASITLDPGDTLLLYTDGIEESRNPNDAMFGVEGIEAAVRGRAAAPRQLVATVRQAVTAHANGRQASDDQTLVAVSVV